MAKKIIETPNTYPVLGRWMNWVDRPGNDRRIFQILIVICIASFSLEWTYEKHAYFDIESYKGFYAYYGFVMFAGLIFVATILRKLIKVRENFYGKKSIDTEDYPEDQIQRINHDA
ncbi:MAG: hypothetical protein OSB15_08560 [Amylibacter sp.]|nr:hypothetical protein [Amylibacter sp.]|tara:strand:+ start:1998 stop:2345 length:348 start_codon:yes stop_codon:yes gene_type:complete